MELVWCVYIYYNFKVQLNMVNDNDDRGGGASGYGDEAQDDDYNMQLSLFTCEETFTHAI